MPCERLPREETNTGICPGSGPAASLRGKVQQADEVPAEEAEEDEDMKEGETPSEVSMLINVKSSYTDNGLTVPQELLDQISVIRQKIMPTPALPSKDEKVTKIETERDVATERLRLVRRETTDMAKAKGELAAAEEAVKKGIEMRALKMKETEEAYKAKLDAIKASFDAGDSDKRAKVVAAKIKFKKWRTTTAKRWRHWTTW